MKIILTFLIFLNTGIAFSQEAMTLERFRQLAAAPGDTNALRPELGSLPFWKASKCSVTMKYQDGKTFKEECSQTARTIDGKYIVFSTESKFYKQTINSVAEYDDKASVIRLWGLYGGALAKETLVFDPEKKINAATSTYGDFMEISVGSSTPNGISDHALVYKDGILFMTRDVKTVPQESDKTQR